MTNRTTLLALAERVEAATGADRELDDAIATELFEGKHRTCIKGLSDVDGGLWMYRNPSGSISNALRYTASLDAAMSLVPSGCFGAQVSSHTDCTGGATCWDSRGNPYSVNAATPALALTAACLRARAIAGSLPD